MSSIPRPLPPRKAPSTPPPPTRELPTSNGFSVVSGRIKSAFRVGVYGPAGVGKSSLMAALAQAGKRTLVIDLDDGSRNLDVERIEARNVETWDHLRAAIQSMGLCGNYDVLVIDTLTKAEDMAIRHLLQKSNVDSLEKVDGGWGKGYRALYDCMLMLLGDLDQHIRQGRNVAVVMHDCTARVPNPGGQDYIRFEPRLYQSDKVSIRARVKEWLDTLAFIGYDILSQDGKARGSGTRTIYCQEQPHFMAKSRTMSYPIVYSEGSAEFWTALFSETVS